MEAKTEPVMSFINTIPNVAAIWLSQPTKNKILCKQHERPAYMVTVKLIKEDHRKAEMKRR